MQSHTPLVAGPRKIHDTKCKACRYECVECYCAIYARLAYMAPADEVACAMMFNLSLVLFIKPQDNISRGWCLLVRFEATMPF